VPRYKKIKFVIDGFTPNTLPLGRLAEYLRAFSALVGPDADIHFEKVAEGSATLVNRAPEQVIPEMRGRIAAARTGNAPVEAVRGLSTLKGLLLRDKTTGRIKEGRSNLLEFPKPEKPHYGPIVEEGTLEGVVVRIGGKDESAHILIEDGKRYYNCTTSREKAKELRNYLYELPIRVSGKGRWLRTEDGKWILDEFKITGHEELNNDELQEVIARMRQIPGSGWDKINDPLGELDRIRKGSGKSVQ
jgi:hypothetical protein